MTYAHVDVALVLMPFIGLSHPSIALGLLKAGLQQKGIATTVHYGNLLFADAIGLEAYLPINFSAPARLFGEWVFASSAFPGYHPDCGEFLDRADELRYNKVLSPLLPRACAFREFAYSIRSKAEAFVNSLAAQVLTDSPYIVGCSTVCQQHCASLGLLRRIRELQSDVITVLGGGNCEGPPGQAIVNQCPWLDYVVSGEADDTFPALCQVLLTKRGRRLSGFIPEGVFSRDICKTTVVSGGSRSSAPAELHANPFQHRAVVPNLDTIPYPDYSDYFATLDRLECRRAVTPGLLIETSRGCWWGEKHHCTFCGLNDVGMSHRQKAAQRIIDELEYLEKQHDVRRFLVVDNIIPMSFFADLIPRLADDARYELFCETKANLTREQIRALSDSGFRWIQPGIESLHRSVLRLFDKGNTPLMNIHLLKCAREYGVSVLWNLLCKAPGEEDQWYFEMAQWVPHIFHLQPPSGACRIRFDRFSPYFENPTTYGLRLKPLSGYSCIYPFEPHVMKNVAFFFERDGCGRESDNYSPGQAALNVVIEKWKELWRELRPRDNVVDDSSVPTLTVRDIKAERESPIEVHDTRPCALAGRTVFSGPAAEVYRFCAQPRSLRDVSRLFERDDSGYILKKIVDDFRRRKLIIENDGRLLSLAIQFPARTYSRLSDFPGGLVSASELDPSITSM